MHLAPLGHGGPNGVYALVTSRQMKKYGLREIRLRPYRRRAARLGGEESVRGLSHAADHGGVSRRADRGRSAVALRLCAGGGGRAGDHRGASRPRCRGAGPACACARIARASTTTTRRATACRPASARSRTSCGSEAGVRPDDIDLASIYDDYPTMVLAQANDLGLIAGNDLARFCRRDIGEQRFPLNTWGGMLSAGQPGGPAGGLNGISEAVLQLAAPRRRAAGEGRAARGRHRLRHDHVPLRRHRRGGDPGAGGMSERFRRRPSGAARTAARGFFRSGCCARAAMAHDVRRRSVCTRP